MAMTLITTNTSSGAATSDFTSSIDSTYKLYIFKFYDFNPDTDAQHLRVQFNAAGASGFDETVTTTVFYARQHESDSTAFAYDTGDDQAQGTAYQKLTHPIGNGGDESAAGELFLFNPSNTTYVKHFYSRANGYYQLDASTAYFVGGYINTTAAIDEVSFKADSGNIDAVIKMYGVG